MCEFFKRKYLGFQQFLLPTQFPLVLQPEVGGTYLPGSGTLGWEAWLGLGLFVPKISLPNFYPPHVVEGLACSMSVPLLPVWMDVVSLIP